MLLVPLVNVVKILHGYNTLETFIALLCLRVECSRGIMCGTVNSERALWVDLLGLIQERVVNDSLANVTFHVSAGLLFLLRVDQALDDF